MRWLEQLFSRRRIYAELSASIREHLEAKIEDLVENGMSRKEAERAARREFGNVTLIEERSREVWHWPWIENSLMDLHFSCRMFMRNPGFLAIVLVSLALGIAATTTIFSAMYGVLLAPSLYRDPHRLVILWESNEVKGLSRTPVAPATFRDLLESNHSFERLELVAPGSPVTVTGSGLPERANIQYATPGLFNLLGVQPALGRFFVTDEIKAGNSVVLSWGFVNRHFAGDRDVIGRQLTINGAPQTIIGVLPRNFHLFDRDTDLWMPIAFPNTESQDRSLRTWLVAVGKLRSGVTLPSAQTEMSFLAQRIATAHPDTNKDWGVKVESIQEAQFGYWNKILYLLFGIVACVLLISCANVTNLLLGRLTIRSRELCLRVSLGAGRGRIVRQLLTEGFFLGVVGSILGCFFAYLGIHLFQAVAPVSFPLLQSIRINLPVLLFCLVISILSGVVATVSPALFASRLDINGILKSNSQTTIGGAYRWYRNAFVVTEIALTLVLLSGAGLMINSLLRLLRVDPGLNPKNVVTMEMFLAGPKYFNFSPTGVEIHETVEDFYSRLLERASALPGVESVGLVSWLPEMGYNTGHRGRGFEIIGLQADSGSDQPNAPFNSISADYFKTLQIPLLRGRFFNSHDNESSPWVAIVNEAFVHRYLAGENPIAKQLVIDSGLTERARQIVGVVKDVPQNALDESAAPEIFVLYSQQPGMNAAHGYQYRVHMNIVTRTVLEPTAAVTAIRKIAADMDDSQPVYGTRTMYEVLSESTSLRRLYASLLELIAGIGLFLSTIGIYGVISHSVQRRTNEIGLRMAVGASMGDIFRLVFRQGSKLILSGLVIGLGLALTLDRFLSAYLFGISASDPVTMIACCALLVGIAGGAIWIPARRATRIDPIIALRYE